MALIQLAIAANKADNLRRAAELITNASRQGAQLIILPVSRRHCLLHSFGYQLQIVWFTHAGMG